MSYENFTFDVMSVNFQIILWGFFIGAIAACAVSWYTKMISGKIVRAVIKSGSMSKESAKTLSEIGIKNNFITRRALKKSRALRKYITLDESEKYLIKSKKFIRLKKFFSISPEKEKIDFSHALFYIPEDKKAAAEIRFDSKGSGFLSLLVSIIVLLIIPVVITYFLPSVLDMIDKFLISIKN